MVERLQPKADEVSVLKEILANLSAHDGECDQILFVRAKKVHAPCGGYSIEVVRTEKLEAIPHTVIVELVSKAINEEPIEEAALR